jgi:hypothetical protein
MLFTFLSSNNNKKNYVIAYLIIHKKVAYEDQTLIFSGLIVIEGLLDFNVLVICAKSMITKEPHKFYVGGGVGCLIQVQSVNDN